MALLANEDIDHAREETVVEKRREWRGLGFKGPGSSFSFVEGGRVEGRILGCQSVFFLKYKIEPTGFISLSKLSYY